MRWIRECVSARDADPLAWLTSSTADERFFWSRNHLSIAATGALHAIESDGNARFAQASREFDRLTPEIAEPARAPADPPLPLVVGGFGFAAERTRDPAWAHLPPLRLWLPERLLVRRDGASWLAGVEPLDRHGSTSAARTALREKLAAERDSSPIPARQARGEAEPHAYRITADRSPAAYRALVAAARDAVAGGRFEKLVVARSLRLESSVAIDAFALADTLRGVYPSCTTFGVARGERCFVGATPERLLWLEGRRVTTVALAGSAPRGRSPEEDLRLATALRESKKEQEEHAVVVRAIRAALEPLCERLDVAESPELLRVEGIQHLATPIDGTLREPRNALDLAGRLHPTPAVAGAPREESLAWLADNEALARGWYAGGVGWLDAAGGGDFAVALRCARLHGGEAQLYAGAGIVAASRPQAELVETRLKLRTLLAPLLEP
jgi:isochorismate synthase